jgi:hypothetical protein
MFLMKKKKKKKKERKQKGKKNYRICSSVISDIYAGNWSREIAAPQYPAMSTAII